MTFALDAESHGFIAEILSYEYATHRMIDWVIEHALACGGDVVRIYICDYIGEPAHVICYNDDHDYDNDYFGRIDEDRNTLICEACGLIDKDGHTWAYISVKEFLDRFRITP